MSRLDDTIHEEEAFEREPHLPLDFLVCPDGYSHEWVCCPFCMAKPDGWTKDGQALYTGGYVTVQMPGGPNEYEYACRCAVGERRNKHTSFFTEAPPAAHFPRPVPAILHVKGERGQGQVPQPPTIEKADEYVERMGEQYQRFMRGEITLDQFYACCQALHDKYLPEPLVLPRVEDVLNSAALWSLYFRSPERASQGVSSMIDTTGAYEPEQRDRE